MEPQVMHVKKLTLEDLTALEQMNTGIDDDYIIRIYDRLIASNTQELFGLFQDKKLVSIGGYSLFGNKKFAMIGRLRSDRRYQSRGYSTELLIQVMEELHSLSHVKWIGANTHVHNLPTRRVLEKIGLESGPTIHYLTLTAPDLLKGHMPGPVWEEVHDVTQKRSLLLNLSDNELGLFPYECYYSFPYDKAFFTDGYLEDASMYVNPGQSRFVLIKNDQKKDQYSHTKYFWNDHYEQPGFFDTILDHWRKNPDNYGCWIDFSNQGFKNIPDLAPYEVQDPWVLYGTWK